MNFYADDHLSTMMLIDNTSRALDFQYILWTFDTSKIDHLKKEALKMSLFWKTPHPNPYIFGLFLSNLAVDCTLAP